MEHYEKYPIWWILGHNIVFILYFALGPILLSPVRISGFPFLSVIYALFLITMLVFVLRKHLCTNCYYYGKWCSTGWGKLAALFFKKGSGNYNLGVKLAGFTWEIGVGLPLIFPFLIIVWKRGFRWFPLWILFTFLTVIVMFWHKKSCNRCKMSDTVPQAWLFDSCVLTVWRGAVNQIIRFSKQKRWLKP